jgi:hypothetical protein
MTPLNNGLHAITVQGACGIPNEAEAVALNVTVVSPTRAGWVTLWPFGASEPVVSTLNFVAGEPALANGAIVPLGPHGTTDLRIRYAMTGGPGTGHLIFDVTGYFASPVP